MQAIEKYFVKQARENSVFWTGVICGNHPATIDPSEYGIKISTFAAQARAAGFKTRMWSPDEIQIYR
jgi:hypothetical protein